MSILLGVNIYAAATEAARRQDNCLRSLRALTGVRLANLQFEDDVIDAEGFETLPLLKNDSRKITGRAGARKPVASEMFGVLAREARRQGCQYFGFSNSDIIITQAAIDRVAERDRQAYIFSRMDFDGRSGEDLGILVAGLDLFVIDSVWWLDNERRFRPYISAEWCWDNVYAAIMLCHSNGLLLNREPLIKHESHPSAAGSTAFTRFNGLLAALDRLYFTLWCEYYEGLTKLRARNADLSDELDLQAKVFAWNPNSLDRFIQTCRAAKAKFYYSAHNFLESQ